MPHFPYRAGNYVLFAELGSGAMGTSYLGRPAGPARAAFKPLSIRILQQHLSQRPELVRILLDEQRAAALLQHPRIASLLEVGLLPDGSYFMASEYVHGLPLREVQRTIQAHVTPAQAVHVAMQLCDALHYAHERLDVTGKPLKIIHGQLSPDAVMIGFDGNAKVLDFGLLRTRDAAAATIPTLLQRRTAFLSPELRAQLPLRSAPVLDRRTDVYSIGALLWEMLTGESLIPSEDGAPPPAPSTVRQVNPQLDAIVMRAMAKAPADRFPTAQAMRLALTSAVTALSSDGSVATGLARSLTVAFRDRMLAFQEQIDLWRKFEDDVLPDAEEPSRRREFSGTSSGGMGRRTVQTGSNPSFRNLSGMPSLSGVTDPGNLAASGQRALPPSTGSTPQQRNTPQPAAPYRESPWKGRIFFILLFVALSVIVGTSVALITRPRGAARDSVLMVDSQPRGAQILVDGHPAGNTPRRISELGSGRLRIEVRKEGYLPWEMEVTPEPGKTQDVDAKLEEDRGPR